MLDASPLTRLHAPQHDSAASLAMASLSCGSRWHCVVTLPHQELIAVGELANQHYRTYLPLHLTRQALCRRAVVPLFFRYAFVHFDPDIDPWGAISGTRGILCLIRHAPDRPTPVPHGVIEHLMDRTSPRGIVDDPDDPNTPPPANIPLGAAVEVADGPMAGLAGIVALSSASRCSVLIRLLGREVAVSLDPRHVRAV